MFDWRQIGIQTRNGRGNVKTTCPQCSANRTNKRDKCLSVNLDEGLYNCFHCGWQGKAPTIGGFTMNAQPTRKTYTKPKYEPTDPQDKTIAWFKTRGISEAVVRRNRIEARTTSFQQADGTWKDERAIAFPYFRDGEIVNIQYRTADKRFKLEKGCELIWYGIDDISEGEPLIIVEGQMDKLALEEAGYPNCVSVPAGFKVGKGEFLETSEDALAKASHFILAGDNDEPGRECQEELARRLGPEKCWRAEWPAGCKDANDALLKHGRQAVAEAVFTAQPIPIAGLVRMSELAPDLEQLYRTGVKPGADVGWPSLAQLYKPRTGEWTMVTGAPGMGKSAVLDCLIMNLARYSDWPVALYSPEQAPMHRHISQLLQLWAGLPFNPGVRERMSWADVEEGIDWLTDHFTFIQPPDDDLSVDAILSLAQACVRRYGIRGLVIDPWNEVAHARPAHMTETEYVSESLSKIRRFARMFDVHVWVMVHPTKMQKDADGSYPVASPYDASGSAHWFNKADMILSIWRDKTNPYAPVDIHVQKVRFKENGELGKAQLYYDKVTGQLSETAPYPTRMNASDGGRYE